MNRMLRGYLGTIFTMSEETPVTGIRSVVEKNVLPMMAMVAEFAQFYALFMTPFQSRLPLWIQFMVRVVLLQPDVFLDVLLQAKRSLLSEHKLPNGILQCSGLEGELLI